MRNRSKAMSTKRKVLCQVMRCHKVVYNGLHGEHTGKRLQNFRVDNRFSRGAVIFRFGFAWPMRNPWSQHRRISFPGPARGWSPAGDARGHSGRAGGRDAWISDYRTEAGSKKKFELG